MFFDGYMWSRKLKKRSTGSVSKLKFTSQIEVSSFQRIFTPNFESLNGYRFTPTLLAPVKVESDNICQN